MASIYTRDRSPFFWIRYKDGRGKWKGKATGYRVENPGDRRQAVLLAERMAEQERARTPGSAAEHWAQWVPRWLDDRYGHRESTTITVYRRYWKRLAGWLASAGIHSPAQLVYRHIGEYFAWRCKTVSANSAIHELKLLAVIMGEAVKRGYALHNPCRSMGLQKVRAKEKAQWTDAEIAKVGAFVKGLAPWMRATFVLGLYQAARMRQCEVPVRDIDFTRGRITYWRTIGGPPLTKGNKPFTQPLDPRAVPELQAIIAAQPGTETLCVLPPMASLEWREMLDVLGLPHLVHHGLRVTWITRAAMSGRVSLAEAKRFVNHGSTAVHEIYQRLNADDIARVPAALVLPEIG